MKNLIELREEVRAEWRRSVYDGYYGGETLREAAWQRVLDRIEDYAHECIAQTADALKQPEPEPSDERGAEVTSTPSATGGETPTIEDDTPARPAKPARNTASARKATPR